MNHDLDVVSRLLDYHDHIAAPPVPLTADLERGRRRIRRNRSLVVGAVALGVFCVGGLVSLFTGAGSADHSLPAGRSATSSTSGPAPDGLGLTTPLVAPTSLLDVRTLGFHVTPVPGFDPAGQQSGWSIDGDGQTVTLRWDEVSDEVQVNVRYQGAPRPDDPSEWPNTEQVTVHGVPGTYYTQPGGAYGIGGGFRAALAWEYAPDSWAYVSTRSDRGDPGPERLRSALLAVAEAIRAGGEPVRVPLRTAAFPTSMPALSPLSGVGVHKGGSGWEAELDFGPMRIGVRHGAVPQACAVYADGIETFTYRGRAGCLSGGGTTDQPPPGTAFNSVNAVVLQVGDTVRSAAPETTGDWFSYRIKEWKQVLSQLTVAPLDEESTWIDLQAAVGG